MKGIDIWISSMHERELRHEFRRKDSFCSIYFSRFGSCPRSNVDASRNARVYELGGTAYCSKINCILATHEKRPSLVKLKEQIHVKSSSTVGAKTSTDSNDDDTKTTRSGRVVS